MEKNKLLHRKCVYCVNTGEYDFTPHENLYRVLEEGRKRTGMETFNGLLQ